MFQKKTLVAFGLLLIATYANATPPTVSPSPFPHCFVAFLDPLADFGVSCDSTIGDKLVEATWRVYGVEGTEPSEVRVRPTFEMAFEPGVTVVLEVSAPHPSGRILTERILLQRTGPVLYIEKPYSEDSLRALGVWSPAAQERLQEFQRSHGRPAAAGRRT